MAPLRPASAAGSKVASTAGAHTPRGDRHSACSSSRKLDPALVQGAAGTPSSRTAHLANHDYVVDDNGRGNTRRVPIRHFVTRAKAHSRSCSPPRTDPITFRYPDGQVEKQLGLRTGYPSMAASFSISPRGRDRADATRAAAEAQAATTGCGDAGLSCRGPRRESTSALGGPSNFGSRGSSWSMIAGEQDLLPAGTRPYVKSDFPASDEHRRRNDQTSFMCFMWGQRQANPQLAESSDMIHCMRPCSVEARGQPREEPATPRALSRVSLRASPHRAPERVTVDLMSDCGPSVCSQTTAASAAKTLDLRTCSAASTASTGGGLPLGGATKQWPSGRFLPVG